MEQNDHFAWLTSLMQAELYRHFLYTYHGISRPRKVDVYEQHELAVLHFKMSFKRFQGSIIVMRTNSCSHKALVYQTHAEAYVRVISSRGSCTKMWLVSFDSMLLF